MQYEIRPVCGLLEAQKVTQRRIAYVPPHRGVRDIVSVPPSFWPEYFPDLNWDMMRDCMRKGLWPIEVLSAECASEIVMIE
jgi:hypothetical protein